MVDKRAIIRPPLRVNATHIITVRVDQIAGRMHWHHSHEAGQQSGHGEGLGGLVGEDPTQEDRGQRGWEGPGPERHHIVVTSGPP